MNNIILKNKTEDRTMQIEGSRKSHAYLKNLDFESSGHTGFQKQLTKEQLDALNNVKNKVQILTFEGYTPFEPIEEKDYLNNIFTPGEYCIIIKDPTYPDGESALAYHLLVDSEDRYYFQYLTYWTGMVESRSNFSKNPDEWTDWEVCNNVYSSEEKERLEGLPTGEYLENRFQSLADDIIELGENTANAITSTVSGTQLEITDISPVIHKPKMFVHGKNMFDIDNKEITVNAPYGSLSKGEVTVDGVAVGKGLSTKNRSSAGENNQSCSFRIYMPHKNFEIGKKYTISFDFYHNGIKTTPSRLTVGYEENVGNTVNYYSYGSTSTSDKYTFTVKNDAPYLVFFIYRTSSADDIFSAVNIQIEEAAAKTDYSDYVNPSDIGIVINENEVFYPSDEGVLDTAASTYPTMKISTDAPGAVVKCTYNKDINKVIEELTNAIISLGGNV